MCLQESSVCVACGSLMNITKASGLRDYTQWGQEQRRAGSSKGAGFGGSKGQPCGLGACEVRTCLWGNVWVRVSVAGGRIPVSLFLSPHPCGPSCSQWLLYVEVTPQGVGDPQFTQSRGLVLVFLFFPPSGRLKWCCGAVTVHHPYVSFPKWSKEQVCP